VTAPPPVSELREEVRDAAAPEDAPFEVSFGPHEAGALVRVEQCSVPPIPAEDAGGPAVEIDVPYGPDIHQIYDVSWPEAPAKALVILIHGGGWTSGTAKLFVPTIRQLVSIGYAAASVGYRLARTVESAFPLGLADTRCAVREVQALAAARGIHKTILLGASAGGHLAAMIALAGDAPKFDGDCPKKGAIHVDGAIAYYPPKMQQAVDELLREDAGALWLQKAQAAGPLHYVDAQDPPMLFLHGVADPIVPIEDSRALDRALRDAHVPSLLIELPEEKHGFFVLGRRDGLRAASCTVLHFLETTASN
jgi:acetyl esterase/lipase